MLGFIIAVIAGFAAKYIEDPVALPLVRALQGKIDIEAGEVRLLAFMITMLVAAIAADLLGSGGSVWLISGGVLGYFALRIVALIKSAIDGRNTGP